MKRIFNIVANVCAIVLMGILLIGAFVLLGQFSGLGDMDMDAVTIQSMRLVQAITILLVVFCIGTIIISAITLAKGNKSKALGLKITVIVLVGIITILEFIGGGYVYGILCLIPIGFEIASICVKDTSNSTNGNAPQTQTVDAQANQNSVEGRINELKHLREIKAITEEQYEVAINALMEELKK